MCISYVYLVCHERVDRDFFIHHDLICEKMTIKDLNFQCSKTNVT